METVNATRNGEQVQISIERDCTVTHEGKTFESGGAVVTPLWCVAYMSADMTRVTDWHGNDLGAARIVTSWRTPQSYVSSRQYQVEATINGIRYTGRTAGGGMLWRGRAKRRAK